jgi:alpha-L-fucosidase
MTGIVLVCKHHDGFCLWPSRYTDYSVKASPWRSGKGDVVRAISDACHKLGMKFGVYLSPWDRHCKDFGTPQYISYYRNQLRELLSDYGPVFIFWIDGAEGRNGYYGGELGSRVVNRATYYDWPDTWKIVRKLQPMAVIRSNAGPDVRWIGNEFAAVPQTCWYTINLQKGYPGMPNRAANAVGVRSGSQYIPPECDVSIRPRCCYHKNDNISVKSPAALVDLYYSSVGHGACLCLGIPLDKRGLINQKDVAALDGMHKWLNATFATNLIASAKLQASNVRGNDRRFAAENILDENSNIYWSIDDGATNPDLVISLKVPITFNVLRICEYLPLGQRVEAFALDQLQDGKWHEFTHQTSIGSQRILRLVRPVTTDGIRLCILKAPVCPAISELGFYADPNVAHKLVSHQ